MRKKPLPNQLPRAPNTSVNTSMRRFAKETKKGRDGLSSQDPKLVRNNSTSRRDENQAANSKDGSRDTAKIKKLPPTKPSTEVPKAVSRLDEISKAQSLRKGLSKLQMQYIRSRKKHYISLVRVPFQ